MLIIRHEMNLTAEESRMKSLDMENNDIITLKCSFKNIVHGFTRILIFDYDVTIF